MRILLLGKNFRRSHNWGHQLFKEALVKGHGAFFYHSGSLGYRRRRSAESVIAEFGPFDLIITDVAKYLYYYRSLRDVKIPKVHLLVDYVDAVSHTVGSFLKIQDRVFDRDKYDIFFARHHRSMDLFKSRRKEPVYYLPFSVDTDVYCDKGLSRDIDVMVAWNRGSGYPNRTRIAAEVSRIKNSAVARVVREKYVDRLQRSKITVNSINQWRSVNQRFTEAMACRSLLFSDIGEEAPIQGFIPGEHFVSYLFRRNGSLTKKLNRWIRNEKAREEIATNGYNFVRKYHSNKVRAKEFWAILQEAL